MEKLYRRILGTPVKEEDDLRPLTTVKDVVIDPESGKLLAFVVNLNSYLIVVPHDVIAFGDSILVHSRDVIVQADDVMRVENVLKTGIRIFQNKVVTEDGKELGIVADYSVDSKSMTLQKLFVAKSVLGIFHYDQRIIPAKNIVEVKKNKIIVKGDLGTVKEEKTMRVEELAAG